MAATACATFIVDALQAVSILIDDFGECNQVNYFYLIFTKHGELAVFSGCVARGRANESLNPGGISINSWKRNPDRQLELPIMISIWQIVSND
ncbi:hypothetical protein [Burkholderia ubonensis]|uniref:hypothetical protein n=1 Tax=Burkholderia ubonensis TaxID=101571 RepID=UPI000A753E15|nr:hypothetical protein [Burkholderia ubonensis]